MDPMNLFLWLVCAGVGWSIFAGLTGIDEWFKSLFGKSKTSELEQRIEKLEKRLQKLEK